MTTKSVLLKLEREMDNGDLQTVEVNIRRMRTRQLNKSMKVVTEIIALVDDNPSLQNLIYDVYQGGRIFDETPFKEEGLTDEEIAAEKQKFIDVKDAQFAKSALTIFRILMGKVPDLLCELLAAMSRMDLELVLDQEPVRQFDIFEAILQTNDVMELIERGKQSSSNIQAIMGAIFGKEPETEEQKSIPQQ